MEIFSTLLENYLSSSLCLLYSFSFLLQLTTMSVIRQVAWDDFTKIVGTQEFYEFIETSTVVVLFLA